MIDYVEEMAKFRRKAILDALSANPQTAHTLHEHQLKAILAAGMRAVSTAVLRGDLQWLHEQGLVYAKHPDGVWLATLTASGADVQSGLSANPGVAVTESH